MPTVLISGANRGIGLQLATQYATDGWTVIAGCRNPDAAGELNAIAGDVSVHPLDISDPASVGALAAALSGTAIDVLFNNAGVYLDKGRAVTDFDGGVWAETLKTNVTAPVQMATVFRPHVAASEQKKMVFVSSKMGSIAECTGGAIVYRTSKTALNMAVTVLSQEFAADGITSVLFHPGHVSTDMGGAAAPVKPTDSAAGMRAVVASLTPADNGAFRNYDGGHLPW